MKAPEPSIAPSRSRKSLNSWPMKLLGFESFEEHLTEPPTCNTVLNSSKAQCSAAHPERCFSFRGGGFENSTADHFEPSKLCPPHFESWDKGVIWAWGARVSGVDVDPVHAKVV